MAPMIENDEFLLFYCLKLPDGKSLGFVDVHRLASAQLIGVPLWAADKKLKPAADLRELTFK